MDWYQKRRTEFSEMVRNGEMTRTDMRNQLRELRGMIPEPSRREQASIVLASQRNSPINQTQPPQLDNPIPTDTVSPTDNTPLQQVVGEIANKIASRISGFIDTLGRRSEAVSDQVQSASSSLLQRINDLMQRPKRRNDQQITPTETNTPTEPTLPEGYDTTRFDTPSRLAPKPIKLEMLQPGGEIYEKLLSDYKSGTFVTQDDNKTDMLYLALSSMYEYRNPSRWQIGLIKDLEEMRSNLLRLGIETDATPNESSDVWNDYIARGQKPITEDMMTDDNLYIAKIRENYQTMLDRGFYTPEQVQQQLATRKMFFNQYEAGVNTDYDQLSVLAEQMFQWHSKTSTQISEKISQLEQESQKNPGNNDIRFSLDELQRLKKSFDEIVKQQGRFTDTGTVENPTLENIIYTLPANHIQSQLYGVYGYDALPQTVDWNDLGQDDESFNFRGESDPLIFYRSIRDTQATGYNSKTSSLSNVTANDIYNSTLNSDVAHVGFGVDGNGMYVKSRGNNEENSAEANGRELQTGREQYGDHTFAMTINKNARIYANIVANVDAGYTSESSMASELAREFQQRYGSVLKGIGDIGILMTMLGYEAYITRPDSHGGFNWNILNRAAMKISNSYIGPDADQSQLDYAFSTGKLP
jgi:hypothetical protein